ncbi:MAG: type II toxin-antitoxin system VapB family antitoxin [Solirubrobacterales bacterium]|nr:type II toxin-antitoxin system VapB family antitoxin [Solirubrobacterales bacterium]
MTRTNIEIDDELIARVMHDHRLPTKRAAVEFALRAAVVEPMNLEQALAMRGTGWVGDLDAMRAPRPEPDERS